MLEAPKSLATSALIPFVPRQVIMLDSKFAAAPVDSKKKKKSKSSKQSETLAIDDHGSKGKTRQLLLRSIAAFLEGNGFSRTLAMFRSEAQIESEDLKASPFKFEDLVSKFLESSHHKEAAINCKEEKDSQKAEVSNKDEILHVYDASEHISKKKRKHKKELNEGTTPGEEYSVDKNSNRVGSLGMSEELEKSKTAEDLNVEMKSKKKKKKSLSVPLEENADKDHLENGYEIANESETNDNTKKKKTNKMSAESNDENIESSYHKENFQEIVEDKIAELKSLANMTSTITAESHMNKDEKKKKKKKKAGADSDLLAFDGNKHAGEALQESESVKENVPTSENGDGIGKKAHKKRKRLLSEERTPQDGDVTMAEEPKHVEEENAANNKEREAPEKPDKASLESDQAPTGKKRKTDKSNESSKESQNQEQDPNGQESQKEFGTHQSANGELQNSGKEGGAASRYKKKEKHSAEPKTVNAFQRVKIEEVKFADERLQDNSYWALDGTGSGYGAKAQEVLGQVRGRDFRHEKTKKKRGSYRGGQIDLQAHSIKFSYSDEE